MKKALIIILYDHPWEHTADYATQACKYVSKDNTVIGVLLKDAQSIKERIVGNSWTGSWRKRSTQFFTYTPLFIIPFRRFKYIYLLNSILHILFLRCVVTFFLPSHKKIVWVFNPAQYREAILLKGNGILVYDCVDFHAASGISLAERQLIKKSTNIFVNSRTLYDLYQPLRKDIHIVPLGFDYSIFRTIQHRRLKATKADKPVIGYIGGINSRLDFPLLLKVISSNPQWQFLFIGPLQMHESTTSFETSILPKIRALFALKNVRHIGAISKASIGEYINQFTIGMIPYTVALPFNKYCFPMKVLEYFYFGKPVIATPIQELNNLSSFIHIGNSPLSWQHGIRKILNTNWGEKKKKSQRAIALSNSWEHKFQNILQVLDA